MIAVYPVPVDYADRIWPWVKDWVAKAIRRHPEDGWTLDSARTAISKGHVATWIATVPKKSCGVLLAEWSANEARIVLFAGEKLLPMIWYLDQIEDWARSHGCKSLVIPGRRGWRRLLRARGYTPDGSQLRKVL